MCKANSFKVNSSLLEPEGYGMKGRYRYGCGDEKARERPQIRKP